MKNLTVATVSLVCLLCISTAMANPCANKNYFNANEQKVSTDKPTPTEWGNFKVWSSLHGHTHHDEDIAKRKNELKMKQPEKLAKAKSAMARAKLAGKTTNGDAKRFVASCKVATKAGFVNNASVKEVKFNCENKLDGKCENIFRTKSVGTNAKNAGVFNNNLEKLKQHISTTTSWEQASLNTKGEGDKYCEGKQEMNDAVIAVNVGKIT